MLDNRKALSDKYILKINRDNQFIIENEAGRGSSCIVYNAYYKDNIGYRHNVRIKEFYPYYINIVRNSDGSLEITDSNMEKFKKAEKKFKNSYIRNSELKNTLGLTNSTVTASNIYYANSTFYTIMDCDEGENYKDVKENDLKSVFIRMKAISTVIKKYHDNGYLHLDIKPENIMIVPETKESVLLFDFDSIIKKEELKNNIDIVFSDGFSAPEQVAGRKNRICEATDIYSIGALLYFKIFGKKSDSRTNSMGHMFDFENMIYKDNRYQPELFKKLNIFLNKTMSSSTYSRWDNIDKVIAALDELIKISDVEDTFIFDNFSYNTAFFSGRRNELKNIENSLKTSNSVFLSGIGGIGKTEIAKRFAFEKRDYFNKIIFVSFRDSIFDTVLGNDLKINNFNREDDESREEFFNRKIATVKDLISEKDLIILDNFDVEIDDNLDKFLNMNCKFIVTTREDFRDFNYSQIDIKEMDNIYDIIEIFENYNGIDYTDEEYNAIKEIIKITEGHTMTVELISKYLRITGESPVKLLEIFKVKEGITATDSTGIKHRKDLKMRKESVNRHLLILFDISKFSSYETEILRSLSLLGQVKILKQRFIEFFRNSSSILNSTDKNNGETDALNTEYDINSSMEELDNLIKRGWIEYDIKNDKISLHQIILDLIYNNMNPCSENCPNITVSMTSYAGKKTANNIERDIKEHTLRIFNDRINGSDLNYIKFKTAYCKNIRMNLNTVNEIFRLCSLNNNEDCTEIICDAYNLKLSIAATPDNMMNLFLLEDSTQNKITDSEINVVESDTDRAIHYKSDIILKIAKEYMEYVTNNIKDNFQIGRIMIDLAYKLDGYSAKFSMYADNESSVDEILNFVKELIENSEYYILNSDEDPENKIDSIKKIKLLNRMKEFFLDDDYCNMYRSEKFADSEKALHYQNIIDDLNESDAFDTGRISYLDMADSEFKNKNYEAAIELYLKEYKYGDEIYDLIFERIAETYEKMGDIDSSIKYLKKAIDKNKEEMEFDEYIRFSGYICIKLINLLIKEGYIKTAYKYSLELLSNNFNELKNNELENSDEDDFVYNTKYIVLGYFSLYRISDKLNSDSFNINDFEFDKNIKMQYDKKLNIKDIFWNSALKYFNILNEKREFPIELLDFVIEYSDNDNNTDRAIKILKRYAKDYREAYNFEEAMILYDRAVKKSIEKTNDLYNKTDKIENNYKSVKIHILKDLQLKLYNIKNYKKNPSDLEDLKEGIVNILEIIFDVADIYSAKFENDDAMRLYKSAEEIYFDSGIEDDYIINEIYKNIVYLSSMLSDDETKEIYNRKCDYIVIAEHDEKYAESYEKVIEIWEDTAVEYYYLDDTDKMEKCYKRLFSIFEFVLSNETDLEHKEELFEKYHNDFKSVIDKRRVYVKDDKVIHEDIAFLYKRNIEHFVEIYNVLNDRAYNLKDKEYPYEKNINSDYEILSGCINSEEDNGFSEDDENIRDIVQSDVIIENKKDILYYKNRFAERIKDIGDILYYIGEWNASYIIYSLSIITALNKFDDINMKFLSIKNNSDNEFILENMNDYKSNGLPSEIADTFNINKAYFNILDIKDYGDIGTFIDKNTELLDGMFLKTVKLNISSAENKDLIVSAAENMKEISESKEITAFNTGLKEILSKYRDIEFKI